MKAAINTAIKEWYRSTYPEDELGFDIGYEVTFDDLHETLKKGFEVYETLGVFDSIVRERCFSELADILDVDYWVVYNLWMDGGQP